MKKKKETVIVNIVSLLLVFVQTVPPTELLQSIERLWRARLSCGRMIRLHAHPLPPIPSVCWASETQKDLERKSDERGGKGPNHTTPRKHGPL